MKKILQYSLYALMTCGFMEAKAMAIAEATSMTAESEKSALFGGGQLSPEERVAKIQETLPLLVHACDISTPMTERNASLLYDFILTIKACSAQEITKKILPIILESQRQVPPPVDQQVYKLGGLEKPRSVWWDSFNNLIWLTQVVKQINEPGLQTIGHPVDCWAYSFALSILKANKKTWMETFHGRYFRFDLYAKGQQEDEQSYRYRIQGLNKLYQAGLIKYINIGVDNSSSELLFANLELKGNTETKIKFVGDVAFNNAPSTNGKSVCDLVKDSKATDLCLYNVDLTQAGNIPALNTELESFTYSGNGRVIDKIRSWLQYLPKTIQALDLRIGDVSEGEILETCRTALMLYPNLINLYVDEKSLEYFWSDDWRPIPEFDLDLKTIAYLALHPSLVVSGINSKRRTNSSPLRVDYREADLRKALAINGVCRIDTLVNLLITFGIYGQMLDNPYKYVDHLIYLLETFANSQNNIPSELSNVVSTYRETAKAKYAAFERQVEGLNEKTQHDEIVRVKNEFSSLCSQLIQKEYSYLTSQIARFQENGEQNTH